jgi:hypothetical protein
VDEPIVTRPAKPEIPLLARSPKAFPRFVSMALQMKHMEEPSMLGVSFPEALLSSYPSSEDVKRGVLLPVHYHIAFNSPGWWAGWPNYPYPNTQSSQWGFEFLFVNLWQWMNYHTHPARQPFGELGALTKGRFPLRANRNEPLLFHHQRRAGKGLVWQMAASGKPCVLLVPVPGKRGHTNADELFDAEKLRRALLETQGAFYRARDEYAPLRPIGNLSVSGFSGGAIAAEMALKWALGKDNRPGTEFVGSKLREIYLFDPPEMSDTGRPLLQSILRLATEWRKANPKCVVRLYIRAPLAQSAADGQALLGKTLPGSTGVEHSDDGRVTVAVVTPQSGHLSRKSVAPGGRSGQDFLDDYGYGENWDQFHQLFPSLFLVDAMRRSEFTDAP